MRGSYMNRKVRNLEVFLKKYFKTLLLIIVTLLLGWFFYDVTIEALSKLNVALLAPIIAGSFTVFVTTISVVLLKNKEKKQQIEQQHQLKKIPVYEEFLDFWFKVLLTKQTGVVVSEQEMFIFFSEFTQKLILWGSDDVIFEYAEFRDIFSDVTEGNTTLKTLYKFEKLLLSIRKDVGHKNIGMKEKDILRLFINDLN